MREVINKNKEITSVSKQIALLKKHFPQAFDKEGNFIPHKIQEAIQTADIDISTEAYGLNWLGKSYARLLANLNEETLLKANNAHNNKPQNQHSRNLLIKGDNLEILKHLTHAYAEKIKMIYIDPPYNTGGDGFVYNDDRKFTKQELASLANIEEDEAQRILDFTLNKSNSHSAWLTFMYPRLYIARELLREDGVIFISIDDNEQAQLKLLCDEVFGEDNFVANLVWEKKYSVANDATLFSTTHDHIIIYGKEKNKFKIGSLPRTEKQNRLYKNPDDDPRGDWQSTSLSVGRLTEKDIYPIYNKKGKQFLPPAGSSWRYSKEKYQKLLNDNRITFGENGNNTPRQKRFLTEVQAGITPTTIWAHKDVGHTDEGKKEVNKLFSEAVFNYPKPIRLIKQILILSIKKQDLVLDFFAGSGTTAHAVMALNAEDGGERQCISVQIAEPTDEKSEAYKAGYQTIFDITKARIEKAAEKIQKDYPEYKGDLGFKIFETIPIFEHYLAETAGLEPELKLFDGSMLTKGDLDNLLTTWKLYDGISLDKDFTTITLADYKAYLAEENIYFTDKNFNTDALKIFLQKLDEDATFSPKRLIIFGYNFDSKTQKEISDALINLENKKSIKIDLDIRY